MKEINNNQYVVMHPKYGKCIVEDDCIRLNFDGSSYYDKFYFNPCVFTAKQAIDEYAKSEENRKWRELADGFDALEEKYGKF